MFSKLILSLSVMVLPWKIRRWVLNKTLGYKIHPDARIGLSVIIPDNLEMDAGARIGHLNVCKGIHVLSMKEQSVISNLNWITGMPINNKKFFLHRKNRKPALYLGRHSAITVRHYLDCTDAIVIGDFTTVAGIGSQFLTHSINLYQSKQDCAPISVGNYCFVGTRSILLPNSSLGDYNILAASSVLGKKYSQKFVLMGGIPAKPLKKLSRGTVKYFSRKNGFVY